MDQFGSFLGGGASGDGGGSSGGGGGSPKATSSSSSSTSGNNFGGFGGADGPSPLVVFGLSAVALLTFLVLVVVARK